MDPACFDESYIAGLQNSDPQIETHFVGHFKLPIWLKARRQLRSSDLAEDACQETFLRIFRYFRSGKRLEQPSHLPAFVHAVCHNVTLEMIRSKTRYLQMPETGVDPMDTRVDLHLDLVTEEYKQLVVEILALLPERDRDLLRLAVLDEMDKSELCRRFGVSEEYLRVLLHRARLRFRDALQAQTEKGRVGKS